MTPPPKVAQKKGDFAKIVGTYTSHFGKNDDQATVADDRRKKRQANAADLADSYYNFASAAYENGWSTHFHYTPFAPNDTIQSAMTFYEHRFAMLMGLKAGMKVLDVGCGIGGPAREIAKFIGCEVVGITINQYQVDRAIQLTAQGGLSDKCTFIKGNFLHLPFASSTFDAAYAIEATVHAPSLLAVYTGIARVLKPGAIFGLSEWVMTPQFDLSNPNHVSIRNRLERGNALPNVHTSEQARAAMRGAGFEILHDEDYANHFAHLARANTRGKEDKDEATLQSPALIPFLSRLSSSSSTSPSSSPDFQTAPWLSKPMPLHAPAHRPWYWPLGGETHHATTWGDWFTVWKMSMWPRRICYAVLWVFERVGIAENGVCDAMTTLAYCVDSAAEGGREGIFTPCWWFIGRKAGEVSQHQHGVG
ncbi:uncharacterized protein Z518_03672 [Rhinocladiella mackenziei CBS 650.93]|uniref:SAM-dependent methyltransferase Erg6/SMT-type domain-containing protein n=1 Tax=Rhinocladiella mackenziei CBS 650.93 TaxID=1442369 RepID=A0A0D2J9A0_9EURO|nr:uncharacterized protein Z518_03672 [Rhinocladiella mackenziei CBS 650.93]KIX05700.1 hypothetical protein Z518_03672 [Rhinocladiella mackenziei CBS 650.93]